MLARNEDELALYDNMDKERYEIERTIYSKFKEPIKGDDTKFFNYRLVGEDELPEWIVAKVCWRDLMIKLIINIFFGFLAQ